MFGLFIITRNRPLILKATLDEVFKQTLQPTRILIVDNSDDFETEKMILALNDNRVQYHHVGYNSGPAGGAIVGMKTLFGQDFEWVVWGDDDDPPHFNNVLEKLFTLLPNIDIKTIGIIGAVGVRFSASNGKTIRIPDKELIGIVEVDNVAGGMFPLIHKNVYDKAIFPDADLFFGFEELDFCLSVKRAGLKIFVSGEQLLRHRQLFGRIGMSRKGYKVKKMESLWREYYSTRNILHILLRKEKSYLGAMKFTFRIFGKMFYGFRFGLNYGVLNFHFLSKGLFDGFAKRMGLTVLPIPKKA